MNRYKSIFKENKNSWEVFFEKKEIIIINYFLDEIADDRREYDDEDLKSSGVPEKDAKWVYEKLNDSDDFIYYQTISRIITLLNKNKITESEMEVYFSEFESSFDSDAYSSISEKELIKDVKVMSKQK